MDGKLLASRLQLFKHKLDSHLQFFATASKHQFNEALSRIDELNELRTDFDSLILDILSFNGECEKEEYQIPFEQSHDNFYETFHTLRAKFNSLRKQVDEASAADQTTPSVNQGHSTQSQLKLPKIDVPRFGGELGQWNNFRSLFEQLVHNNNYLSNIEKFQYLCSYLCGEPLDIVNRFLLTKDNYDSAWLALKERYQSERLLISHYVSSVINFKVDGKFNLGEFLQVHENVFHSLNNLQFKNLFEAFYYQICLIS